MITKQGRSGGRIVESKFRKRARGMQGKPTSSPWVREQLYEWFVCMRYSIDWKECEKDLCSGGKKKCMGRFTRDLLRKKVQQLLNDYSYHCLMNNVRPSTFKATARWFDCWEREHGLNMKKPNRKYKVPKAVMAERVGIGWCNVARIRALCLAIHGYDPEIENWDQSPFHNNESGSQNVGTLGVVGSTAPLIEGHADTRERWSGNFTTFSNKDRIIAEGPPYCEFMFEADGGFIELRLREHLRSGGFGSWVSVATSPKGSYRLHDVLSFLERHLPPMSESRGWRIIMADDLSAHTSHHVFRFCWSRGYVFIAHGGGVTPVVQTPDTDLNQHVRRDYTAKEIEELMQQMRDGVCVPRNKPEKCIDMMVEVLSRTALHLHAADGYVKTGMTVALNGDEDHMIVREAGEFWNELRMREKINSAVAEVREEVEAGRIRWTEVDVQRLIRPYPKHTKVDALLEMMQDDTWMEEGERAYQEDEEAEAEAVQSAVAEEAVSDEEAEAEAVPSDVADADEDEEAEAEGKAEAVPDEAGKSAVAEFIPLREGDAERLRKSQTLISTYQQAMANLKECGAIKAAVDMENCIRKERRRMRAMSKEDDLVLLALARARDEADARDRKRRRLIKEANEETLTHSKLRRQIDDAKEMLKRRKQQVVDTEALLESKHALKNFSLVDLGQGRSRGGGAAARKRRFEVLDRLARIGRGLSAAQKNDFTWFKEAWDSKMLDEHWVEWAGIFAGWMQQVLVDFETCCDNAFSVFVHAETRRCFDGALALRVP